MSEPLSPAAMAAAVTSAARPVPRAVSHFGLAAMEARAARTRSAIAPLRPEPAPAAPVRRVVVRLWLPLTPLFLLLAPFAVLLAPVAYVCTPPRFRIRPFAAAWRLGAVLLSLSGVLVHVDTPDALVSIRIF